MPRRLLFLLSAVCIALPFLVVTFPPITDLPQHTAQVRLLIEAVRDPLGPYRIQLFTPYWGAYWLLGILWTVLSPLNVGRIGMLLLGVLWAGALHGLAARRGRAPEAAVLASLLFFNHTLYWGFGTFLAGWPAFILWLQLISAPRPISTRRWVLHLLVAALLFWCHVLWFAAGLALLAVLCLVQRRGWKASALQASATLPFVLVAAWWYPQLAQRGFGSGAASALWLASPLERVSPSGLTAAAFGGLRESVEGPVLAAMALWGALALWQSRKELRASVDSTLLSAGLLLLGFALVLPDKHTNTIYLASRWMPCAVALLLLAFPVPRLPLRLLRLVAGALTALLVTFTALVWREFERTELSGLRAALEALPSTPRVLGLDFVRRSRFVQNRPFLQLHAYAQVMHGGMLNFSFANFAPSPVVFRVLRPPPWTNALEWFPERVKTSDFFFFDYVLLGTHDEGHAEFTRTAPVLPVTDSGVWRLYRVRAPNPAHP